MFPLDGAIHIATFLIGALAVLLTLASAIGTFVLPRSDRNLLSRLVFRSLRKVFNAVLHFSNTYERSDAIMAYYAPYGLMLLLPAWYLLLCLGYTAIYWSLGAGDWATSFDLSGSSLFTLGFTTPGGVGFAALAFSEGMLGLIMVALLIAYLPTMYAAFSRREQVVNMLVVRAGMPPSALEMLLRFARIHGLERLSDYWRTWEGWFADLEETHTTLAALVFFRSPQSEISWITAAGAVLDAAAMTRSVLDLPADASADLCIRAGFLALRRIANQFALPNPPDPHFPDDSISIHRSEFDAVIAQLEAAGLPLKPDREQAWLDFAGWRVNYDRSLVELCGFVMAPFAVWSSDRGIVRPPVPPTEAEAAEAAQPPAL
jgi:hypothetical protein